MEETVSSNKNAGERIALSRSESKVFLGLALQRGEIHKAFQEVLEAESEYIDLLLARLGLSGEHFIVRQNSNNELYLQRAEPNEETSSLKE